MHLSLYGRFRICCRQSAENLRAEARIFPLCGDWRRRLWLECHCQPHMVFLVRVLFAPSFERGDEITPPPLFGVSCSSRHFCNQPEGLAKVRNQRVGLPFAVESVKFSSVFSNAEASSRWKLPQAVSREKPLERVPRSSFSGGGGLLDIHPRESYAHV